MSKFIDHDLNLRVTQLQEAAEALPQGDAREALMYRAARIEAASLVIERWATSPGLRAPR